MSLVDILAACFGGGAGGSRQAPYLSAQEAEQMPLDVFLQRSIESAPSAMQQSGAFADIFRRHLQNGASPAHVGQVVQDALSRLASNDTDRATAQWAGQLFALSLQSSGGSKEGGYSPPKMQGGSYAQAAGSDSAGWEMQGKKNNSGNKQQQQQQQQQSQNSNVYIRSYFFPSEKSFSELVNFLDSARSTLDICVFNITDNDLARAIGNAKRRGVNVRIITDDEQLKCQGNDVVSLNEQYGIPYKTDNDPQKFMHSKFAIIDSRAVWVGSFNWTVSARRSNNESVVCTNDPRTAQEFSNEFERLWKQF